ncbi:MAG: hypothetical protein WD579_03665 [Candidatus Paceibacterota bacterium]
MTRIFAVLALFVIFSGCTDQLVSLETESAEGSEVYSSPVSISEVQQIVMEGYLQNNKAPTSVNGKSTAGAYATLRHAITFNKGDGKTVSFYDGHVKLGRDFLVPELMVRVEAVKGNITSPDISWRFRPFHSAFASAFREIEVKTNAVDTWAYFTFPGEDGDVQYHRYIGGPGVSTLYLPEGEGYVRGKSVSGVISKEVRFSGGDTNVEIVFGDAIQDVTDLVVLDWATIDSVLQAQRNPDYDQILVRVQVRDIEGNIAGHTRDLSLEEGGSRVVGVLGTPRDITLSVQLYEAGFYRDLRFFIMSLKPESNEEGKPRWLLDEVISSYTTKG